MAFADLIKKYAVQPEYSDDLLALQDPSAHEEDPNTQAVVAPKEEVKAPMKRASDDNEARRASSRADIEKLLKDFDEADHAQKRGNIVAGLSEAGMEFGHAFGGEPVDKEWSKGIRERAGESKKNVLTKEKLKQDVSEESRKEGDYVQKQGMNNQKMDETGLDIDKKEMANQNEKSLMDAKSPESSAVRGILGKYGIQVPESADARSILSVYPFVKEDFDAQVADKRIKAETMKADKDRSAANWRNTQDNQTSIINTGMRQNTKESIAGMRPDQQLVIRSQRHIPGFKSVDGELGFVPTSKDKEKGSELAGSWHALEPLMRETLDILKQDPRTIPGSDKWNTLQSKFAAMYQGQNKVNANGVMNFGDWDNLIMQMGNPNTINQWANQGARKRLETALADGERGFLAKMHDYNYEPGDEPGLPKNMTMGGGGMSGGGSRNNVSPSPEALNQMAQNAGLGNLGLSRNAAPQPQKQQNKQVVDRVVDKATGTTLIQYSDGTFDEVR